MSDLTLTEARAFAVLSDPNLLRWWTGSCQTMEVFCREKSGLIDFAIQTACADRLTDKLNGRAS